MARHLVKRHIEDGHAHDYEMRDAMPEDKKFVKPIKYEYKRIEGGRDIDKVYNELNSLGKDGYRVYAASIVPDKEVYCLVREYR